MLAFDADGNAVPVTFSDLEGYHRLLDANTVTATGASNTAYNTAGAPDSVTVDIAGPITRLEVSFLRAPGTTRTGQVGISDLTFDAVCFTPGAQILTERGQVSVEDLSLGDRVFTRDNQFQEIRWIGRREMTKNDLEKHPHVKPIRIRKDAFGEGFPNQDMVVSPQHRMLV